MGGANTFRAALAVGAAAALLPAGSASAADQLGTSEGERYVPGQVLVRYDQGTSSRERASARGEIEAEVERRLLLPRTELLDLPPGVSVAEAVAALDGEPDVAFAEPNFTYRLASTFPDDTLFQAGSQWALDNQGIGGATADADIDATEAWDVTQGSDDVVVAVVDSGAALNHPDLDDNLADPVGWDFVDDDDDPMDGDGHGTHVAGTIGAEGDNSLGATGVNWDVSMMILRACDNLGVCPAAAVADAFQYAGANGAPIVNASLSGTGNSLAQAAAINSNPGTLFVVAAGNQGTSNDSSPRYPCNYTSENLVCVGATTDRDTFAGFSNFGAQSVDIAAPGGGSPGDGVVSTYTIDRMPIERFSVPLGAGWDTGGLPDTWQQTEEPTELTGGSLTDSVGGDYANNTDNYAKFGPVDLDGDSSCHLRYELQLDVPDPDDHLEVQMSGNGIDWIDVQDWTGVGAATLTPQLDDFDISSTTYIRFHLESDASVTGDGAHIDDVRIRCPSEGYRELEGTSMAAPHVSGAAALLLSEAPGASATDLRDWLIDGVDLKAGFENRVAAAGRLNVNRSLSGALGADIERPDTSIVGGPATASKSTSATFSFTSTEPATFSCSLNGSAFSACPSPRTIGGLAIGTHTFRVKATDQAGNEDATPAAYSFAVQASPAPDPCAALRKKLRRAKSEKQRKKLRAKLKRRCSRKR